MVRKALLLLKESPFVRNSAILFAGTMAMNVLNYVFHLVLGRLVSAEVYGGVESLISLLTIVSVPATALALVATKYAAGTKAENHPEGSWEIFRLLNAKVLTYGVALLLIAMILTPWVRGFLQLSESLPVIFLWLTMFLAFPGAVATGILSGWQRFGAINQANIWSAFVKLALMIILVKLGFGISGIVGGFVVAALVGYGISLLGMRFLSHDHNDAPEEVSVAPVAVDFLGMKQYVVPALLGTLAITALGNIEMLFAKHHLSGVDAGTYGALFVVSRVIFFATGVIASVLFAMSAEESHRKGDASHTFRYAFLLAFLGTVVFVAICTSFPKFVLGVFFGQKYVAASGYLGWMALAASMYSLTYVVFQYLLSIKQTEVVRALLGIATIGAGALFFFGGSIYAILGVVIAMQLSALLCCLWFVLSGRKRVDTVAESVGV